MVKYIQKKINVKFFFSGIHTGFKRGRTMMTTILKLTRIIRTLLE